jgi:RHS repeat-associated protein
MPSPTSRTATSSRTTRSERPGRGAGPPFRTLTGKATYSYDALDRTAQETENHPTANLNRTTTFSYEGLTNLVTKEIQDNTGASTSTDTKTYNYDTYGNRISLNDSTVSGGTTTTGSYTYGYDVHDSASLLVNQANGTVKASYGYTPYGASDTTLSKGDTALNTPFNPYRYTAKRYDTGSQTLDMGVRRFDPTSQRFLQMDQYQGALANLALSADPLTHNRYNLGGGNPLSAVEYDGHKLALDGGGGSATSSQATSQQTIPGLPADQGGGNGPGAFGTPASYASNYLRNTKQCGWYDATYGLCSSNTREGQDQYFAKEGQWFEAMASHDPAALQSYINWAAEDAHQRADVLKFLNYASMATGVAGLGRAAKPTVPPRVPRSTILPSRQTNGSNVGIPVSGFGVAFV